MRLHPAESRIRRSRLKARRFALFDMLQAPDGTRPTRRAAQPRHAALAGSMRSMAAPHLSLTPGTPIHASPRPGWMRASSKAIVAKRLDGPYAEGERAMIKVKRQRTADCVVGGFRYGKDSKLVGSFLLGLYDAEGRLNHVGFTSGLAAADKSDLTRRLEALAGGGGFTGDAPGGPSRWSDERSSQWTPLTPQLVVEVSFDHVSGGRFRHGTKLIRFRPDKAPDQCTMEQLG
jgi:ATP-dependent DNA ligase